MKLLIPSGLACVVLSLLSACAIAPFSLGPTDREIGSDWQTFKQKHGKFDRYIESPDGTGYGLLEGKFCTFQNGVLADVQTLNPTNANYTVALDGYFDTVIGKKVKIIHVGQTNDTDMISKESRRYLRRLFAIKGIEVVEDAKDSDIIVLVSIGISDPNVQVETIQVPLLSYDGPRTSRTTFSNGASATTTTDGQGLYVSGYSQHTETHISYTRYVLLKAIDTKAYLSKKSQEAVWQIRTISIGQTGDLRRALPVHYGVILEYFGENTGSVVDRQIAEDSFYPTLVMMK